MVIVLEGDRDEGLGLAVNVIAAMDQHHELANIDGSFGLLVCLLEYDSQCAVHLDRLSIATFAIDCSDWLRPQCSVVEDGSDDCHLVNWSCLRCVLGL